MKRLFIEPLDVLMFRSERPFAAIESHVAKLGVISPLTFEGAIKSKIFTGFCHRKGYLLSDFQRKKKRNETKEDFEKSLHDLKQKLEEKLKDNELRELLEIIGYIPLELSSKLNVFGVFFAQKEEQTEHFPIPNDIVQEDRTGSNRVKIVPSQKIKLAKSGLNAVLPPEYPKVKDVDGFMDFDGLKRYLWGGIPEPKRIKVNGQEIRKPYVEETRCGIQLKAWTKTTEEGALYTAEFLRVLEGWGFVVWYESPQDISDGLNKLGGEGRGVVCKNIKEIDINEKLNFSKLVERINEDRVFRLYVATPSYFGGCLPPKDELEKILGVDLNLVAAVPGKPAYIGGYDFAMNKEKPLRRWVNAGAVYYYKFHGEIRDDLNLPIKIIDGIIDMRCALIGIGGDKNV